VNEYVGERILIHFDMYRIHNSDELFDIGWEDYLRRNAICVVEWSENVPGAFDGDEIKIFFKRMSDNERLIAIMEKGEQC
jgi:tRNA threonylcarbamoyladenosine biosynthesis protein TsaE